MVRRIVGGVFVALLPVAALWAFALWERMRDPLGYGMAVLPLIAISAFIFTVVFVLFLIGSRKPKP
jgi:hypothetical protein